MKNAVLCLLLLLVLGNRCANDDIGKFFGRPELPYNINNGDGTGMVDGVEVPNTNHLCIHPDYFNIAEQYYHDNIEKRLYICIKFPRRCK